MDLLDELFRIAPDIPFATGPYARGFCYMLNEDGSVNEKRCREYYASKAKYDAEFDAWKGFWVETGKMIRGEDGESE